MQKPDQLNVPADKFQAQFGVSWEEVLKSGKVFNAMDGCQHLGIDAQQLNIAWSKAKAAKKLIKFGGGFYCGLVEVEGKEPVYIFNGFFMAMRSKFTAPSAEIYYYLVEWDANALSWADFRGKVLGPTDPAEAPAESLRGQILSKWEELGLKEKPLNVPADKFQEQFGVSWEEALKSGKVFNAMDGCQHLGIDAGEMDAAWSQAKAAKKLIKFGGGFYCGLVEVEGKEPVYIFNGFFMAMRSKFTKPGSSIYYFSVEWDANALSWADFRGKVLGPTDPAEAPAESLRGQILSKWEELGLKEKPSWADFRGKVLGPTDPAEAPAESLRGQILSKWEELGLKEKPNVGDNGMHASASPFEGFAERNNWLEMPIKDDPFGARLLQRGSSESLIRAWSVDPQVNIAPGRQGSVFDQLEDLDTAVCLEKLLELKDRNLMNAAFVFIKPHAMTEKVKELAKTGLQKQGIKILKEGSLKAETIDQKKLIDQHYYAIASKATILKPDQLNVPADKFQEQFGVSWEEALKSGKVFNAMDGCQHLGIDAGADKFQEQFGVSWEEALKSGKVFNAMDGCQHLGIDAGEMDAAWSQAKAAKKLIKFGGGFYRGLVEVEGKEPVYIFNGFFMAMRSKFTKPGSSIYYFSVEWDANALSWADFRGKVLGPTDPAEAPAESLRGQILSKWEELGLTEKPNVGDNGMHASASPFEGFAERNNWLSQSVQDDTFGAEMLKLMAEGQIKDWSVDPQIQIGDGKQGSVFDQLEDLNVMDCGRARSIEPPALIWRGPRSDGGLVESLHAASEAVQHWTQTWESSMDSKDQAFARLAFIFLVVNVAGGLVLTAFYYNFTAFEVYIMSLFWAGIISIPLYQVKISIIDLIFSLTLRETYRLTRVVETNPPQDRILVGVSKLPRFHWLHVDEPESTERQQEFKACLAEELMSSSELRRNIEEKGKGLQDFNIFSPLASLGTGSKLPEHDIGPRSSPASILVPLSGNVCEMNAVLSGLFFLAALLVPLSVIFGLLSHHPGGGLTLDKAFAWHPILMSIAFPGLMVLGRWVYVTDIIEEKGLRRALHGSIMAFAALVALGGYVAMFKAHWPIKQYFGYNFTTQKWAVPARVIHDLIGYSTLLLVLFQAAIGMVKIVKLQNKIKSFTFHGTLGKVIMGLSAVNILVACTFWKWTTGYKILAERLAMARKRNCASLHLSD
eukprot:s989_g14.t1